MKPLGDPEGRAADAARGPRRGGRSPVFLIVAGAVAVLFFVLFVVLGTWQVKRRVWKLDLIARVEQRVHAPAAAAPGPAEWPNVTAAAYEYRHVAVTGTFLDDSQTLVQAVTDLGAGYWVLTPLQSADGSVILVNRGFVQADDRDRVQPGAKAQVNEGPASAVKVTGLLRMTEPRGGFLRHNEPAANRWYSRDVQAIAAARGLTRVAPYFIDAEAAGASRGAVAGRAASDGSGARVANGREVAPVAGLTVITFHNSHLVYAITWYTLALMVAGAIWLGVRNETRT